MPPKISGKPKCHECRHKGGPRSTANLNKDGQPKKKPCTCNCHVVPEPEDFDELGGT